MKAVLLAIALLCSAAPPSHAQAASAPIVLLPEQSTGGNILRQPDGKMVGVTLDKSCATNFVKRSDACVEWKLAAPLAAGWWHGTVKSNFRAGYANRDFAILLASAQKPSVPVAPNFVNWEAGRPQVFEFWIYTSSAAESVRLQPSGDLWYYNQTWPVSEITLERREPEALTVADAVALDLPAQPDGSLPLPTVLPPGNWSMAGVAKVAGSARCELESGRAIEVPLVVDRYKRPSTVYFFADAPLRGVALTAGSVPGSVVLRHNITRASTPLASDGALTMVVDPSKVESGELLMVGAGLTGEGPTFPLLPRGQKTAVLTTWDDGKPEDLRCAEILTKHGYHPTFFLNMDSPAMKFLDKLEALNVEVGSHCFRHPSLYAIPPQSAVEECVEMRKVLEKALQHPVISFGYPNGYSPAYDVEGDYVLRAVKAAGYWSGRTTWAKAETVESYGDLTTMAPDGFFGNAKDLERVWATTRTKDGGVFYFWGHSWQIGKTDEQWAAFDAFVAQFAQQPNTWYPSQGEFSVWLWARKNVQITIDRKSDTQVTVTLRRPWLHPYLATQCPLSLSVPAGVEKVRWRGREIPVAEGCVELPWVD